MFYLYCNVKYIIIKYYNHTISGQYTKLYLKHERIKKHITTTKSVITQLTSNISSLTTQLRNL